MCAVQVAPDWLGTLNAAVERPEWLKILHDVDEVAVRLFLERHDIPDAKLRADRVENIGLALDEGRVTLAGLGAWRAEIAHPVPYISWINEFSSKQEIIEAFRARHDTSLSGRSLDETALHLLHKLWRKELELRTWIDFIDLQKEQNPRELFLYRVPDAQKLSVELLAPRHVEEPKQSELVEVAVDPQRQLTMRWVAMRGTKRRVTFARVDLTSGAMELQLERMDGGGMPALVAERNHYARAVAQQLAVTPQPLRLETAMRGLMSDSHLRLTSWRVRLPGGGETGGKHDPGLFERLRPTFELFYALELKGEWEPRPGGPTVTVNMDTRTDAISVRAQCSPAAVAELLETIRELDAAEPPPAVPQPHQAPELLPMDVPSPVTASFVRAEEASVGEPASDPVTLARIAELEDAMEKLIAYQHRLGQNEVQIDALPTTATDDLLYSNDTLQEALHRIGVRSLGAMLYVLCPVKGIPVQQRGSDVLFERADDIPEEISCENDHTEPKTHLTQGNVWLRVISPQPPAEPQPVPPVLQPETAPPPPPPAVQRQRQSQSDRLDKLKKVCVWYVIGSLVITVVFAVLFRTFPELAAFLFIAWVLTILAPLALIRQAFGPRVWKDIKEITEPLLKQGQKGDGGAE